MHCLMGMKIRGKILVHFLTIGFLMTRVGFLMTANMATAAFQRREK